MFNNCEISRNGELKARLLLESGQIWFKNPDGLQGFLKEFCYSKNCYNLSGS